jgi:hypothetical protein
MGRVSVEKRESGMKVLRCLGAFIPTTTFIRDMRTLLQIRQFAQG